MARDHLVTTGISAGETATEIVNLARASIGIQWTVDGCTDFCWGISNLAGVPFFDLKDLTISGDPTAPQDVLYVVPSANNTNTAGDGWTTVLTTNSVATLTSNMQPGDIVRIYGYGNTAESSQKINGHFLAHEFIVVSVSNTDIQVVDNWSTAAFNTQEKVVQHSFSDIVAAFAQNGVVNSAYVSRLDPTYVSQNFDQSSLQGHGYGDFSHISTGNSDTIAPSLVHESGLSLSVGETKVIGESVLQFDDNVSTHSQETYSVLTAPAHGVLLKGGLAVSSFTQADIDSGLISYREDGSAATSDSFFFKVSDAANNQTTTQQFQFQISQPAPAASVADDFNHDGYSDILFRNSSTGDWGYDDVHNGVWHGGGTASTAFGIAGVGDFNGDGSSDVLWRNGSTGDWGYLDQNGSWHGGTAGTAFSIAGTGDFNHDGYSDILWRNNSTGDWGFSDLHNNAWNPLGGSSTAFKVAGTGDFNHDGYADVLWRNSSTGDWGYSDVHNGAWHGGGTASTAFNVAAVGDFNADGYSDVLWRNSSTGDWGYSDIHNNAWHGGTASTAYSVAAVGDYNHDNYADIMWRNASTGDWGWSDVHNNAWHGLGTSSTAFIIAA